MTNSEQDEIGRWAIGLYRGNSLDRLSCSASSRPILSSQDFQAWNATALADPFAIYRDGQWYLFFELFIKNQPNAVIGAAQSSDLRRWTPLGIVLQQPHHLSYPFVFEHEGQVYMMPESKGVKRVDIYQAVNFPFDWEFKRTILKGRYMDCSMAFYKGRYWLFAGWRSYWLRLFHSQHPLGPWIPHWLPSIRHYCRSSTRPGGRPIQYRNQLIRFSQDNQNYYGEKVRAWQITHMSSLWYSDRPLYDKPILSGAGYGWNARCMHHIDPFVLADNIHKNSPSIETSDEIIAFVDGCA